MIQIHDDVLPDADAYRARALAMRFQTVQDGVVQFRGIAPCADPTVPMWLVQRYPQLRPTTSFFRQSPLGQVEPHTIHADTSMGDVTAILYLSPDPPEGDGTNFFQHVPTGKLETTAALGSDESQREAVAWFDASQWTRWRHVPAKFNRLVVFPAALFHARAIEENYGAGDEARLIQVIFSEGRI